MAAASHSNFSWFASVSGSRWPDGPIQSAPTRLSLRQISTRSLARWAERLKANISHRCDATGILNDDTPITESTNGKKKARAKYPRLFIKKRCDYSFSDFSSVSAVSLVA